MLGEECTQEQKTLIHAFQGRQLVKYKPQISHVT